MQGAKHVTFTDIAKIIPSLTVSVNQNLLHRSNKSFDIKELDWNCNNIDKDSFHSFDYIIGADIIYDDKAVILLIKVLYQLSSESTTIIISYETHVEDAADVFWQYAPLYFQIEKISSTKLDSFYQSDSIDVLHLKKLNNKDLSVLNDSIDRYHWYFVFNLFIFNLYLN